jgi:excisionase family DNA binding protein
MFEHAFRAMIREEVRAAIAEALATPKTPMSNGRLTIKEAAAVAKVSEKTVRNWLKAEQLTAYHAGRHLRVDAVELDEFMAGGFKADSSDSTPEQLASAHLKRQGA